LVEVQTRSNLHREKETYEQSEADEVFGVTTPGWAKPIRKTTAK